MVFTFITVCSDVLIATPSGAQIPIEQVAKISFSHGPAMIRDEDGQLTGSFYIDLNTKDYGGFVNAASGLLAHKFKLPPGYNYSVAVWVGYILDLRSDKPRIEESVQKAKYKPENPEHDQFYSRWLIEPASWKFEIAADLKF